MSRIRVTYGVVEGGILTRGQVVQRREDGLWEPYKAPTPEREWSEITLCSDITVRLIQSMGGDHMVAAAAKVSTDPDMALALAEAEQADGIRGLINYLMSHRHGTPFEHNAVTFYVHAPAMVWWEWVRHRVGFSYNLESGRYKELAPVFWVPKRERRLRKVEGFKSARPLFERVDDETYTAMFDEYVRTYQANWDGYQRLMRLGIANEAARSVLGFGVYYSGWVTANCRSLMHFLSLRTHNTEAKFVSYPQQEIELAASQCEQMLANGWPLTYQAWVSNGRVAP
jgi:thymidylate synthase (FAD)